MVRVERFRILAVGMAEGFADRVLALGPRKKVDKVGHEASSSQMQRVSLGIAFQEGKTGLAVLVVNERACAAFAHRSSGLVPDQMC